MRIVIATNTYWNIFNFRLSLVKKLQRHGHEVIAVSHRDNYVSELEGHGVKCIDIPIDPMGINLLRDLKTIYHYFLIYKVIRPDLILSYTVKPNIYGSFVARFLNIPNVSTVSGLGTLFIKETFMTTIAKLLYRLSLGFNLHVFFHNNDDREIFISKKILEDSICSVVPGSGVDVKTFTCKRTQNNAERFLFVGRIISDKGVIEYLEAAVRVIERFPDKEFLLVGELGAKNRTVILKDSIKKYTDKYAQIQHVGKTEDIVSLLRTVDVVVLPSYREGLSKSLVEAASMMLPIITSDVPGCRDVVEDGVNGFLCEVQSMESLEKAVLKMIELPELKRLEFGRNGRRRVESYFSAEIVNNKYITKVNKVISG